MAISSSEPIAPAARRRSTEHWVILGGTIAAALAILVLGLWITPDARGFGTHEQLGMAPCHFLAWTGFPCPGCGVTTSVSLAAHGSFAQSLSTQPLGTLLTILVPIAALFTIVQHARGRDLGDALRSLRPLWWALAAGVIATASWIWKIVAMRG